MSALLILVLKFLRICLTTTKDHNIVLIICYLYVGDLVGTTMHYLCATVCCMRNHSLLTAFITLPIPLAYYHLLHCYLWLCLYYLRFYSFLAMHSTVFWIVNVRLSHFINKLLRLLLLLHNICPKISFLNWGKANAQLPPVFYAYAHAEICHVRIRYMSNITSTCCN